jgi:mono/diheme cytochrome c family protein
MISISWAIANTALECHKGRTNCTSPVETGRMADAQRLLLLLGVATTLAGCSKPAPAPEPKPTAAAAPTPAPVAPESPADEAKAVFAKKCVVCHGDHGEGDGPGGAALDPKPRKFSDAAWQAATTDERIAKVIVLGGPGVGLSPGMAANPELANKPEVVQELVKIVRQWRK